MPERGEIAITSDFINEQIFGKQCNHLIVLPKSKYYNKTKLPLYDYIHNENQEIYSIMSIITLVTSRGKKMIIELNNNVRFISSFGLHGNWSTEISIWTCLCLTFDNFNVYYNDKSNMGLFDVCLYPSSEYEHVFKNVGPDLLTEEVNFDVYKSIISRPRIKHMKIMEFMMEQKYLSGVGAYLRSEILYRCQINPHRILSDLTEQDVYNLFYFTKVTIWESYKGNTNLLCYNRSVDDNNYSIITEKDRANRTIHWCPSLQI